VPLLLDILEVIQSKDMPALGLHDSIICRRGDRKRVKKTMAKKYRKRFGFDPLVKYDFK
jgi:hypothetical protein